MSDLPIKIEEATEQLSEFYEKAERVPVRELMAEAKRRKIPRKSMKWARNSWALSTTCINGVYYWERG